MALMCIKKKKPVKIILSLFINDCNYQMGQNILWSFGYEINLKQTSRVCDCQYKQVLFPQKGSQMKHLELKAQVLKRINQFVVMAVLLTSYSGCEGPFASTLLLPEKSSLNFFWRYCFHPGTSLEKGRLNSQVTVETHAHSRSINIITNGTAISKKES